MQTQLATQDRNWAMAAHLSALVAIAGLPFGHILGPLVVYLVKARESEFVAEHARASLNYQITISLLVVVATIVGVAAMFGILIPMSSTSGSTPAGFAVLWICFGIGAVAVLIASLVFIIMGTVAASEGRPYTYPFAIRFLR
ncbi:MAG TPA: DUF4870 domain-containing protein [Candidatus Dormibacteraeota bacterium]|nr:DUF4870 domain-containing protein [Candidatus Dormibacteraeota bacterium]